VSARDATSPTAAPRFGADVDDVESADGAPRRDARAGVTVLIAVFVVGLALRTACIALPRTQLFGLVIDDGAYYSQIARNLWRGEGSTFDGIHQTNGYHPLWAWVLVPLTGWIEPSVGAIRWTVLIQVVISAAAFVVAAYTLERRFGALVTGLGLGTWWLNPASIVSSVSGVEAALVSLVFAVLVASAMRYRAQPTPTASIVLGAVAGLLFLARSDAAVAAVVVIGWAYWPRLTSRRTRRTTARQGLLAVACGVIVVAPWIVWNLRTFGTLEQSSTWARPMAFWDIHLRSLGVGSDRSPLVAESVHRGIAFAGGGVFDVLGISRTLAVAVVAALAVLATVFGRWDEERRSIAALGALVVVVGAVLGVFHAAVRWIVRGYYFEWTRMGVALLVVATLAVVIDRSRQDRVSSSSGLRPSRLIGVAFVVVFAWNVGSTVDRQAVSGTPWQPSMVAAGEWVREHVPEADRVGSFNAGFIGYLSGRTVVNLDGVVDNAATAALRERDLAAFICDAGVAWLVDFHPTTMEQYSTFMGTRAGELVLDEIAVIRAPGAATWGGSEMKVMRVTCGT
jgi:hypothetical protein